MTLDTATLRLSLGIAAITTLVLFFRATWMRHRAPFAGWWSFGMACSVVAVLVYLLNGSAWQAFAQVAGNSLSVLGATALWAASRSLRGKPMAWGWLLAAPAVAGIATASGDPGRTLWAGASVVYLGFAVTYLLTARENALLLRAGQDAVNEHTIDGIRTLCIGSLAMGLYYLGRAIAFEAAGPGSWLFDMVFGTPTLTLLYLVLLIITTFSMYAIAYAQQTQVLRNEATRDTLTGLMNRKTFERQVRRLLAKRPGVLMIGDYDHFKAVNDQYGHAAGDKVLRAFGVACRSFGPGMGMAGRWGGEEFVVFMVDADAAWATQVAGELARRIQALREPGDPPYPTMSWGAIESARPGASFELLFERADAALYQAKDGGRDRVVFAPA